MATKQPVKLSKLSYSYTKGSVLGNEKPRYIYALVDPRDNRMRYIGASTNPWKRYREHCAGASGASRARWRWTKELRAVGMRPKLAILQKVPAGGDWRKWETWWIVLFKDSSDLTNTVYPGCKAQYTRRYKHVPSS